MPRLSSGLPKYRRHRASGQAIVTLNGRDFYLGPHGSQVSRSEYDRVLAEWLVCGRRLPSTADAAEELTVAAMLEHYAEFARVHYRKNGVLTHEYHNVRLSARAVRRLYGHTRVADFGPLALKAVRQQMISDGLCRGGINGRIGRIKRIFRWAVSEQLIEPGVLQGLETVRGLEWGRSDARETEPIGPVTDAQVDATLPFLPPVVADMVRLQKLTGCRPGEICALRPADVDRNTTPWTYRPASHKTEHRGRDRAIFIGPRAQAILGPYLQRPAEDRCFVPAESEKRRKAALRAHRKTPVQPSQRDRRKGAPQLQPGAAYDKNSYARAVRRACDAEHFTEPRAGIPHVYKLSPTQSDQGSRVDCLISPEQLSEVLKRGANKPDEK